MSRAFATHVLHRTKRAADEAAALLRQLHAKRQIARYFRENEVPKLQFGSGSARETGWLQTDIAINQENVIYVDATRPLPFRDGTFHYVHSEHMIEHIPYPATQGWLRETYRVLKPGGVVRVATPDLGFLVTLLTQTPDETQRVFINAFKCTPSTGVGIINMYFREWGHLFLYDERTLRALLVDSGFGQVTRHLAGQSHVAALQNIEWRARKADPDGQINRIETLVLEAVRPPDAEAQRRSLP